MSGTRTLVEDGLDLSEMGVSDALDTPHIGFKELEENGETEPLEVHRWHRAHDPGHVNLFQEAYTPDEVARMLGTSLEVVMHAIWSGELRAERVGHDVVCIAHYDLCDWLVRRGRAER
jgi:excisionase family DNA binding protein